MNYSEIKQDISTLRAYQKFCQEKNLSEFLSDNVKEMKQRIRRKLRLLKQNAHYEETMDNFYGDYSEDGCSYTEYQKISFFNREHAEDWTEEIYKENQIYSDYDCTGEFFISGIRFAHMHDDLYLVRIRWSRDV